MKKGISLIVLVVTIIVMIILASAVIISLSNSNIIERADEAVDKTDETTIKELATLAWLEAYDDGIKDRAQLESKVKEYLLANGITEQIQKEYIITVTTEGVNVAKDVNWKQEGTKITRGTMTVNVGDTVYYDETKDGTVAVDKDLTWKVIGAENGELLIMSMEDITQVTLSGKDGYVNGLNTLNAICSQYKNGNGATDARTVKVEDVTRITPVSYDGPYGDIGYGYGGTYTYTWSKVTSNSGKSVAISHNSFTYFNGLDFVTVTSGTTPNLNVSLKGTYWIDNNLPEVFMPSSGADYWCWSQMFNAYNPSISEFSVGHIGYTSSSFQTGVSYWSSVLVKTNGTTSSGKHGVRAVVSLKNDIKLSGNSTDGWWII